MPKIKIKIKILSVLFAICLALPASAQNYNFNIGGLQYSSGPAVPGACSPDGRQFFKNATTKGWYTCIAGAYVANGGGGSGSVTGVLGTSNQINSDGSSTTPTLSLSSTLALPGTLTSATAGAASTPAAMFTGAPFTGGTTTTTYPLFYLNSGVTQPTTLATLGTFIGINAPVGFSGNWLDFHINGAASVFSISNTGSLLAGSNISGGAAAFLGLLGRSHWSSPADGIFEALNAGGTGFTRLQFGGTTTSFPGFTVSGTSIIQTLATGGTGGSFGAGGFTPVGIGTPTQIYNTAATASAASVGPTTMFTPALTGNYWFKSYLTQTVLGASCAGNTTVVVKVIYQDPSAAGAQTISLGTYTIVNNGTIGVVPWTSGPTDWTFVSTANAIQVSTTYTGGGSCSPAPTVQLTPILVAL